MRRDRPDTTAKFLRGLTIGALIGAVIAGSRLWRALRTVAAAPAVVIAGGGPTGLMLAGELALAGVDVAIVERRAQTRTSPARARAVCTSRTIEVLDQRGIADRFLAEGQVDAGRGLRRRSGSTSATFRPGTTTGSRCGRSTSSASSPTWVGELEVPIHLRHAR